MHGRAGWRQDEDLEAAGRGLSLSDDGSPLAVMRRSLDLRPPATAAPPAAPLPRAPAPAAPSPAPAGNPTTPNPLAEADLQRRAPATPPRGAGRGGPLGAGGSPGGSPRTPGQAAVLQHDRVALQLGRGYK
jgi:hypothetical protein